MKSESSYKSKELYKPSILPVKFFKWSLSKIILIITMLKLKNYKFYFLPLHLF